MQQQIDQVSGLIAQVRPLLVYPLVQGEARWMLSLLIHATESLMETAKLQAGRQILPQFMSLGDYDAAVEKWHYLRYGGRTPDKVRTLAKAREEFRELEEELAKSDPDPDKVAEEAADVLGVLFNLCRGHGRRLSDAMVKKLQVIYRRLEDPNYGRHHPASGASFGQSENPLAPTWCGPTPEMSDAADPRPDQSLAGVPLGEASARPPHHPGVAPR